MRNPTSDAPRLPRSLPPSDILLGWSLEDEHPEPVPFGFSYGQRPRPEFPDDYDPILHRGEGHLMTIAPTGAGKGISAVIPTLLRYQGQAIVIDPKGENYHVTARARRAMGQRVILLDPFRLIEEQESDRLDPMDILRPGPGPIGTGTDAAALPPDDLLDGTRQLARSLIPEMSRNADPFWESAARRMVSLLLAHIVESSPRKLNNLGELLFLIGQSDKDLSLTARDMARSKNRQISNAAHSIFAAPDRTRASIVATALGWLEFLQGNALTALQDSTFLLTDLIDGAPMTIYMVIPPDKLPSQGRLLRIWLTTLLSALSRRKRMPERPTLVMMDEAAQLGRMDEFLSAVTLMRGYGVKIWSFWQDFSQLTALYPGEWRTILNNTHALQMFGLWNARLRAEAAEMTGFRDEGELREMDRNEQLLTLLDDEPVIARCANYLEDPAFAGLADPNPFYTQTDPEAERLTPARPPRSYARGPRDDSQT